MNGMTTGLLPEGTCTLSVVVPVYNEADGLLAFHRRLRKSAACLANEPFRAGGR